MKQQAYFEAETGWIVGMACLVIIKGWKVKFSNNDDLPSSKHVLVKFTGQIELNLSCLQL